MLLSFQAIFFVVRLRHTENPAGIRQRSHFDSLWKFGSDMRYFAASEVEGLVSLSPKQRCESFYVTWTRKEALVKALGLGLSFPLDAFCTGRQDCPPRLTQGDVAWSDWTIADLAPGPGYEAAIAVRQPDVALHFREVNWAWLLARSGSRTSAVQ
jgi:phosphopantetheinyl transferase